MEKLLIFVVLALFMASTWALPPRQSKQYRSDYKYNGPMDAFYKLHTEARTWAEANRVCSLEGAKLMVPQPEGLKLLFTLLKGHSDLENVWIGSDEGTLNIQHYRYNSTVGSCYYIPLARLTWEGAYAECRAQNAHLVILNSETERDVVRELMASTPKLHDFYKSLWYFAGFRAEKPVGNEKAVYRTIFDQTLEEAGFTQWTQYEPNNWQGLEYCGSLTEGDGNLNDYVCSLKMRFICEKENISES